MKIRSTIISVHDILAVTATWLAALLINAKLESLPIDLLLYLQTLPIAIIAQGLIFQIFSIHRDIWRFVSIHELTRISAAVLVGTLPLGGGLYLLSPLTDIPILLLLNAIMLVMVLSASRITYRIWKSPLWTRLEIKNAEPVIVIGAGAAAASLLRDWSKTGSGCVVALLDDNLSKRGRVLCGVKVVGPINEIGQWAEKFKTKRAIIAMPSSTPAQQRLATELAQAAGLVVFTVPALADILSGQVSLTSVRKVELEDLLRRGPAQLDRSGLRSLIDGATVMVTGAGGSIGSELCRQIAYFKPNTLVCFDISEIALYNVEQEFSKSFPSIKIIYAIGDVKNTVRIEQIMKCYEPKLVFHAAAYKHVPMMEQENAWEAVQNNVHGTICLALSAVSHNVQKFVLVSTDKAVNPTNVMGATKRLAELCCKTIQKGNATQFVTVRFGNVMGSSGSVIPKFREQIANGGPVTVTHPDIVRYFMLIPEAAQLVLQAALMGLGGEIFVLDMGKPVRIVDLARDLIRLSGFSEDTINIKYTGLRPGEKLFEELLADDEVSLPTPHPALRVSNSSEETEKVNLNSIREWLHGPSQSEAEVKLMLTRWVTEYRPQGEMVVNYIENSNATVAVRAKDQLTTYSEEHRTRVAH